MDRRSTSEEPESKGDEPFATNSTGEFVGIAAPLDFEEQHFKFLLNKGEVEHDQRVLRYLKYKSQSG